MTDTGLANGEKAAHRYEALAEYDRPEHGGVIAIDLDQVLELPRTDKHANEHRYKSRIWIMGKNGQTLPSFSMLARASSRLKC